MIFLKTRFSNKVLIIYRGLDGDRGDKGVIGKQGEKGDIPPEYIEAIIVK